MHVLVVGATGVLGRAVVQLLREQGHRVRGMTRRAVAVAGLEAVGVEPVIGDLTDPTSLERACRGVERVLAAAHGLLGRGRYRSEAVDDAGHRALIDAARAAGVARLVYTSAAGAAPDHPVDFLRTKGLIEEHLAQSGLPHTILRPSAFMEWHAHAFNGRPLLEKGRTVVLGTGTKPRNFIAATDVAAYAAHALARDRPAREILTLGGPGNFTNDDIAALYARIAGIPPRVTHVPPKALAVLSRVARPLHPGVARMLHLASLPDDAFPETLEPGEIDRDACLPVTPLEAFVRERVAAWRARSPR